LTPLFGFVGLIVACRGVITVAGSRTVGGPSIKFEDLRGLVEGDSLATLATVQDWRRGIRVVWSVIPWAFDAIGM
jgi:hypothetical protein